MCRAYLCAGNEVPPATNSMSDSTSLKQKLLKSNVGTRALGGAAATAAASANAPGGLVSCTAGVAAGAVLAVLGVPAAHSMAGGRTVATLPICTSPSLMA